MKSSVSLDLFPSRKCMITKQALTMFNLLHKETSAKRKVLPVEVD